MSVKLLKQNEVNKMECPKGKEKLKIHDQKCRGLILEVRPTGIKTYFMRYKTLRGRYKQIKLGRATDLSVNQARKLGHKILGDVAMGKDPQQEKKVLQNVPTFEEFVWHEYLPYIESYKKSWKTDVILLRNHLIPKFGGMHMDQIKRDHIISLHQQCLLADYKPATANRLVILLRYIFNLALKWDTAGVRTNPTKEVSLAEENNQRDRYLDKNELDRLCKALKESENPLLEPIILMLLLTGARKSEVLKAKWHNFDFERRTWQIPGTDTKTGKTRTIPLSDSALEVLDKIKYVDGCPYVFPNPETQKPFTSIFRSWDTARKKAGLGEVRIHDLRHSFSSFLINSGRSIYEVSELLGHTQIKTTMRYAHLANQTLLDAVNSVPLNNVA